MKDYIWLARNTFRHPESIWYANAVGGYYVLCEVKPVYSCLDAPRQQYSWHAPYEIKTGRPARWITRMCSELFEHMEPNLILKPGADPIKVLPLLFVKEDEA